MPLDSLTVIVIDRIAPFPSPSTPAASAGGPGGYGFRFQPGPAADSRPPPRRNGAGGNGDIGPLHHLHGKLHRTHAAPWLRYPDPDEHARFGPSHVFQPLSHDIPAALAEPGLGGDVGFAAAHGNNSSAMIPWGVNAPPSSRLLWIRTPAGFNLMARQPWLLVFYGPACQALLFTTSV